jgi:hypothetical protein
MSALGLIPGDTEPAANDPWLALQRAWVRDELSGAEYIEAAGRIGHEPMAREHVAIYGARPRVLQ